MPSILHTKDFGDVEFEKFWTEGGTTIGKLTGGRGYAHTSGLMIQAKKELDIIPRGIERDEAFYWWDHRLDAPAQARRRIVIDPDTGGFMFDDGSAITDYADITQNIPPGPLQNAALDWFSELRKREQGQQEALKTPAGKAAASVAGKGGAKKPAPKAKPKKEQGPAEAPTVVTE